MTSAKMRVGETFEGPSKTLTDAHFLLFSSLTGDVHPSHYDAEYAKQTRFKKPIAHGLLRAGRNALGASTARDRLDGLVMVEQSCRYLKPAVRRNLQRRQFRVVGVVQIPNHHPLTIRRNRHAARNRPKRADR